MSVRGVQRLCFSKGADDIRHGLEALIGSYETKVDELVKRCTPLLAATSKRELFKSTFRSLADADGHAALASAELTLPALVSGDAAARAASSEAKKKLQHMWSKVYARPDVYNCMVAAQDGATTAEEQRLVKQVLSRFKQSGVALPTAEARAQVAELNASCSALSFEIEQNINEDCTEVLLAESELQGCEEAFIKSLPVHSEESPTIRKCSVKAPVLLPILKRATSSEARRSMKLASEKRCMDKNGPLLDELLTKRHEAALLLGFPNHAERMCSKQMAQTADTARAFCNEMLDRVAPLRDQELKRLSERKQVHEGRKRKAGEEDGELNAWDTAFYSDLLKREELTLDDEKLKEFFPLVATIDKLLDIYSMLLGLSFVKNDKLPRWHDEVVTFEVRRGENVVGHLYLDQFPRDGKFGHQMIVPIAPSFVDSSTGERCVPACCNISNLPRPQGDKPALLRFAEMQTLFHELGHAMHCLCTTTEFSILSWAWPMVPWPGGVEQDFLEVPSMALEKFACEPVLLSKVAQHFSGKPDAPKMESETIEKIKALEKWMVGTMNSRYFAMALFDLQAHSQAPPYTFEGEADLSAKELYERIIEKYTKLARLPGTHPIASWYHLVIGYDAGYYGYGWSDVYAADLFKDMLCSPSGLLSVETGTRLRNEILGPCATRSGTDMLQAFLGRAPSSDAWCERNGIPLKQAKM
jgi:thimet oligopeptidase